MTATRLLAVTPSSTEPKRSRRRSSDVAVKTVLILPLVLGAALMAAPLLWMVSLSLKTPAEIFTPSPSLMPQNPTLSNYVEGWTTGGFSEYFGNSLIVTSARVVLSVILNSMAGYALAKYNFKGKNFLFLFILMAFIVPDQVLMVPLYMMMAPLGLLNSLTAVIIPGIGLTFGAFVMRQYLASVPDELLESARIDGASEWRIFLLIMPLAAPAIVVNALFQFIWAWNDLLWPLLFLQSESKYTVQLALANFRGDPTVTPGEVMAMSLVSVIPVVILFFLLQRYFVRGIAMTGFK